MVSKWGPDGPPDDSYTLDVSADGTVRVVISDALSTGSSMTVRLSSAAVPLRVWTRMTITWAPGQFRICLDGRDVSGAYPGGYGHSTAVVGDSTQDVWIGRSLNVPGGGQSFLHGRVDEVAIHDEVVPP